MAASPLYYPDAGPAHAVGFVLLAGTLCARLLGRHRGDPRQEGGRPRLPRDPLGDVALELAAELVAARAEEAAEAAAAAGTTGLRAAEGFRRLLLIPNVR